MLQRDDRVKGGRDGSSTESLDGAVIAITEEEFGTPPDGADGEDEVEVEVEAEKEIGRAVESTKEDILSRRSRVIKWLGRHCIYCEVKGRRRAIISIGIRRATGPRAWRIILGIPSAWSGKMGWITFGGAGVLGVRRMLTSAGFGLRWILLAHIGT